MGKGEIFSFIKEDQAIVAPDAIKNVNILKEVYTQFMGIREAIPSELKIAGPKEMVLPEPKSISNNFGTKNESTETKTTQTINVNITVDGKNVSTMTNLDPNIHRDIEKKIKDTIQNISFWDKSKSRVSTKR
jgi:hypothetical protein